ncbi:MAG: cytidine deaminase [Anaerolineae bacterium]|nr:cytidine deaminase [Anaerolineae bacterium]
MTDLNSVSAPNHQWETLLTQAIAAREYSYSPYSKYKVGAALLTKSGKIYTGCNIENVGYSATVCAERTAIFKAVSEGETSFEAIAVATENSGPPCGICRQVIREFASEFTVIVGDIKGHYQVFVLSDLLPHSFGPEDLTSS